MSSMYQDRAGSRGTRSSESKHKHHKGTGKPSKPRASEKSSSGLSWPANAEVSFLFVVNELKIQFGGQNDPCGSGLRADEWSNVLPPENPMFYEPEGPHHISQVMRFRNGEVTVAGPAYRWVRQQQYGEGCITMAAGGNEYALPKYKSASVFSCNPSLPIITLDGDARTDATPEFHALQFYHPVNGDNLPTGVSQAAFSGHIFQHAAAQSGRSRGPTKFVAGINASWIPSLVPELSHNRYGPTQSVGLSGQLGIIIGLMAFHAKEGRRTINEVFLGREGHGGLWKSYRWRSNSLPIGYPDSEQETPRGYLVHICLDPENQVGSTEDTLSMLEWNSILVQG